MTPLAVRLREPTEPTLEAKNSNAFDPSISSNAVTVDPKVEDEFLKQFDFGDLTDNQVSLAKNILLAERDSFSVNDDDIGCAKGLQMKINFHDTTPVQK